VGPILRTPSDIPTFQSKSYQWCFEKPQEPNAEIIESDPPILTRDFFNLRDCLVGNWRSPASFFIVNFRATSCKLPTPLTDVFDIHARLSIHFRQLAMNFDWFNAFCVQKPNYCSNFAPGGSSKWKLHFKRLPSQD